MDKLFIILKICQNQDCLKEFKILKNLIKKIEKKFPNIFLDIEFLILKQVFTYCKSEN